MHQTRIQSNQITAERFAKAESAFRAVRAVRAPLAEPAASPAVAASNSGMRCVRRSIRSFAASSCLMRSVKSTPLRWSSSCWNTRAASRLSAPRCARPSRPTNSTATSRCRHTFPRRCGIDKQPCCARSDSDSERERKMQHNALLGAPPSLAPTLAIDARCAG
mgnify:CR=1 FL=1